MRRVSLQWVGAASLMAAMVACGFGRGRYLPDGFDDPGGGPSPKRGTASVVITGKELARDGRPLLDVMRTRVPGLQITLAGSQCPEVLLRGRSTLITQSNPSIYVDGEHASNTCILNSLNSADIARVEVYPQGVTSRPGYLADPYGLILIFMRETND